MKKILRILFIFFVSFFLFNNSVMAQEESDNVNEYLNLETPPVIEDQFYHGLVTKEPSEKMISEYGINTLIQAVNIQILSGPHKDEEKYLEYSIMEGAPGGVRLEKGDRVVIGKSMVGGEVTFYIGDTYRLDALWWLLGLFLLLVLVLARWAGVRAVVGLLISFAVIIWFIVPRIASGENALYIAFLGTMAIATVSLFIAHGFRSRTTIAFIGTVITISSALLLSIFVTDAMHLFGLGSEEAFYLQASPENIFNLRGILLAGIIIGTLGVLDDITTAQAAVTEEIHLANKELNRKELFKRASSVGREHIISLVNTLILAYTGASLPLLLLFQVYERPAWLVLNSEIVMEELARMLIGSTALIFAIPLTTGLAAWYYTRKK